MVSHETNFLSLPQELRDTIYDFYTPNRKFYAPCYIGTNPNEPFICKRGTSIKVMPDTICEELSHHNDHALALTGSQVYEEYVQTQRRLDNVIHVLDIVAPVLGLKDNESVLLNTLKANGSAIPWDAAHLMMRIDYSDYFSCKDAGTTPTYEVNYLTIDKTPVRVAIPRYHHTRIGKKYLPGDSKARATTRNGVAVALDKHSVVDDMLHLAYMNGVRALLELLPAFKKIESLSVVMAHEYTYQALEVLSSWIYAQENRMSEQLRDCVLLDVGTASEDQTRPKLEAFTLIKAYSHLDEGRGYPEYSKEGATYAMQDDWKGISRFRMVHVIPLHNYGPPLNFDSD